MRTSRIVASLLVLSTLSGCSLLKKKGAEADDASAPPTPSTTASAAPAPPSAANENAVARYSNEVQDRKDTTVNFSIASVTDAAGAGKTVTVLKKGTSVTQLATRGQFALVVFKDPKDASRSLMGWVGTEVFGEEPKTTRAALKCKANEKVLRVPRKGGLDLQCQRPCNPDASDTGCTGGLECINAGLAEGDPDPNHLTFFCAKPPPPPPLVCSAGESKLKVRFPSGVEDLDCVQVCAPSGGANEDSDKRCSNGNFCGGVAVDPPRPGFCIRGKRATAAATAATATSTAPTATATATASIPKPPAVKVKCVLPSPPPCPPPHAESPKGLCQVPCPTGDCGACGGSCQKGFCVGG